MSYSRAGQGNRNAPRTGGWGDRPTGLASSLPAPGAPSRGDFSDRRAEAPSRTEEAWKSEEPREPRGWGRPGGRRSDAAVDEVDDKFSRSFKAVSSSAPAPAPSSSGRGYSSFDNRRDDRREGYSSFETRRDDRREEGGRGFSSFDNRRDERRGDDRDEPRRFGGRDSYGGGYRDRNADSQVNAVDDKFSRAFSKKTDLGPSQRDRNEPMPRRDLQPFGEPREQRGYDGERSFGGRSNDARKRGDDSAWKDDPRFAGKFSGGGREGGDARRGGRGRDFDPSTFDGPLPTAPRSAVGVADPEREKEAAAKEEQLRQQKLEEEQRVKAEKEAAKAARKKAEEDAKKAKEEAKKAEEEAKNAALNSLTRALQVTADAIANGLKGEELTAHLKKELTAPIVPAGVLKSMLASLKDDYTTVAWYGDAHFGHALKNLFDNSVPAQVSLLYAVQAFCHEKKFPKIKTKSGAEKRLIEVLVSILLNSQIVDVDGLFAWADDDNVLNLPGRTDAIVQTTEMVTKLREAMMEEEEEEDYDDEDFQQKFVK